MKQFFDHFQIVLAAIETLLPMPRQISVTAATFDKKLTSFLKSWERAVSLTAQSIVNTLSTSGPATAFLSYDPTGPEHASRNRQHQEHKCK